MNRLSVCLLLQLLFCGALCAQSVKPPQEKLILKAHLLPFFLYNQAGFSVEKRFSRAYGLEVGVTAAQGIPANWIRWGSVSVENRWYFLSRREKQPGPYLMGFANMLRATYTTDEGRTRLALPMAGPGIGFQQHWKHVGLDAGFGLGVFGLFWDDGRRDPLLAARSFDRVLAPWPRARLQVCFPLRGKK